MTTTAKPAGDGRFKPGHSGNPAGARLRRQKPLLTAEDLDRIVLQVASSETSVTLGGDRKRVTLYEANVVGLGSMNPSNRLASKDFLEIVNRAAQRIEHVHKRKVDKDADFDEIGR